MFGLRGTSMFGRLHPQAPDDLFFQIAHGQGRHDHLHHAVIAAAASVSQRHDLNKPKPRQLRRLALAAVANSAHHNQRFIR